MKELPLVSVVIPAYKVEKYLEKCVESVISQTYKNIEIILVNDGSPDRSPEICDRLADQYTNISVIHKENGGLSDARNEGIKKTKGEYILFLDSDDTLIEGAINDLVQVAAEKNANLVIPDRYIIENEKTGKKTLSYHFDKKSYIKNPNSYAIEVLIGKGRAWRSTSVLYEASLIKEENIQFPVGLIYEDMFFNLRVLSKAKQLAFHYKATLNNLKREGSITSSFQKDLEIVLLRMDKAVTQFLIETNQLNKDSEDKRKELLARNTIIYIKNIYSKKCNWNKNEKYVKVDHFLKNKKVIKAFEIKRIRPYSGSILSLLYYKVIFRLIKMKKYRLVHKIARLAGKYT